jgi:two-component system phosphate regulon response regulator PhoB
LNSPKAQVLLADAETGFAATLRHNLETQGFLVDHVMNGQEALSRIAETQPPVVVLDWTLPGISGIEVSRDCGVGRRPER